MYTQMNRERYNYRKVQMQINRKRYIHTLYTDWVKNQRDIDRKIYIEKYQKLFRWIERQIAKEKEIIKDTLIYKKV